MNWGKVGNQVFLTFSFKKIKLCKKGKTIVYWIEKTTK